MSTAIKPNATVTYAGQIKAKIIANMAGIIGNNTTFCMDYCICNVIIFKPITYDSELIQLF
jgi:hypothetical protein